jgi:hypothetical protein
MNCHDFEAAAGELAAGRPMDAAQRKRHCTRSRVRRLRIKARR